MDATPDTPDTPETPDTPAGAWPRWVETWILPYVDDFALWPVAFAVLAHVVVILVPLELAVVRSRDLPSMAVLALLAGATFELARMEWRARGGLGRVTGVAVVLWLLSLPAAWYANDVGVL